MKITMWAKLSKLPVQIIAGIIIIFASYGLLYLLAFKEIPEKNHDVIIALISGVIGTCVTPVMGWLYTTSKGQPPKTNTPENEN